jgi:hypothetical protein
MKLHYEEDITLKHLEKYVFNTTKTHYAGDTQAMDLIISSGKGMDFILGNIIKYADRCGKKDSQESDLTKIAHYAMIGLYITRREKERANARAGTFLSTPPETVFSLTDAISDEMNSSLVLNNIFDTNMNNVIGGGNTSTDVVSFGTVSCSSPS